MTSIARAGSPAERRCGVAAVAVAVALLPLMIWMSRDFGVTWDEIHGQAYGERLHALYRGVPSEQSVELERLYGALFDASAVALQRIVPADLYVVRHGLNAFFGWLAIVGCGLLALRLHGTRAALLAMVLLALVPPFMGHSMNNGKDIPFAAMATLTLAGIAWLPERFPYLPVPHAIGLGLMVAAGLAVRPGALLFAGYTALWVVAAMWLARERSPRNVVWTGLSFTLLLVVAFLGPMPVWPALWDRPVVGILEAVEGVSRFDWTGTVLFRGRDVQATELPWSYAPIWLTWTTPPVVLAGLLLSLLGPRNAGLSRRLTVGLWFATVFPVAYVIARHSTLYDGVRHLLFILPPMAALAAAGWVAAVDRPMGVVRWTAIALLALGLAEPLVFQVRNHPNQAVYFQPFVGGPSAAYARFELDYWGNCLLQAMREVGDVGEAAGMPISVSGRQDRLLLLNAPRVHAVAVVPPNRGAHALEIYLLRGQRPYLRAFSMRDDILWQIRTADGAPLCAVTKGPQFDRLRAELDARGVSLPRR
jgi:hypothetical protein